MRVAVLGWYPLRGDRIAGGPEAVIVQQIAGLQRQGDVDLHMVVCDARVPKDFTEVRNGLTLHALRLRRVPRWTMLRANARAVRRVVDHIQPDVVHAHGAGLFADAALMSRRPAVITLHGVIEREAQVYRQHGMRWRDRLSWAYEVWYERWCLRRARDIIAISPYVEATYRHRTAARMHHIDNPVAEPYFHLPDRVEPATILCAARVVPRKNILNLLRAFAEVHHAIPESRLRLAGEIHSMPGYVAQCRQAAADLGVQDAVAFLDWLDEPAVQDEYSRCICTALVSWQETAPIAIEQAMAAGKAVVASDVGGVADMLAGGQAGLLVQPDDVAGIGVALRRALEDAALRRRLGDLARAEALRRFQVDVVAAKTRALYERLLA